MNQLKSIIMESLEKKFYQRLIAKSEAMIIELEKINTENQKYFERATKSGNVPLDEVNARMKFARENQQLLQQSKTRPESLLKKLEKLNNGKRTT